MSRRDALRLALLTGVAYPLLTACGQGDMTGRGAAIGGGLVKSGLARSGGTPDAIPEVMNGLHAFAGHLYAECATTSGNIALSPYSAFVALAMTLPGAGGSTASEMRDVLGVTGETRFHGGLNALASSINGLAGRRQRADGSEAEVVVDTANQLFGQHDVDWDRTFLDLLAVEYGAGLQTADFKHAHERARVLINDWVAGLTHDRIRDLVPPGAIDPLTRLVLVNALYLKAPWETPFEKARTTPMPFNRADGGQVQVETMAEPLLATTMTHGHGWRAARLPYAGRALAMTVVLPDLGQMGQAERMLTGGGLASALTDGRPAALELRLPRWSLRSKAGLVPALKRLGMETAFDPDRADFHPMTGEDLDLYVSQVLQECFVAVDEEGTEAAAATAVVMRASSAPTTEPFHVDRPFLFVIHDVAHGAPLMVGRVDDPTA